jgi:Tfp pilus assembly protein PilF
LSGNIFSVCIAGIMSDRELLVKNEESAVDNAEYDALSLARDYIEYSQLDEALDTLEKALMKAPERHDIEIELINLLKVTRNSQAFSRITNFFVEKEDDLSNDWQQLASYFSGINNE